MPSLVQLKLSEKILNLLTVKVIDYTITEDVGMLVQIAANSQKVACPRCGEKSEKLHQNHWFLARDISLVNQDVYLKIKRRQLKCERCQKPFSEELDFVKTRRSYTKRLATQIVERVLSSNPKTVAQQNNISEDIVERMLKDVAQEKMEEKPKELKRLGLDEIALVKGQGNYCAVLVDERKTKINRAAALKKTRRPEKILGKLGKRNLRKDRDSQPRFVESLS